MSDRDTTVAGLAEVLAGHDLAFRWTGEYECDCGDVFEVPDGHIEEAQELHRAHLAAVVLAHLEAQGWAKTVAEEWAIRRVGSDASVPQPSKERALWLTEGPGLEGYPDEAVRRRVSAWEPVETGDRDE